VTGGGGWKIYRGMSFFRPTITTVERMTRIGGRVISGTKSQKGKRQTKRVDK